jgi:hypothetical protein
MIYKDTLHVVHWIDVIEPLRTTRSLTVGYIRSYLELHYNIVFCTMTKQTKATNIKVTISYLGLRTWGPMWSGKSQLSWSQHLTLHQLTSSDVEFDIHVKWPPTTTLTTSFIVVEAKGPRWPKLLGDREEVSISKWSGWWFNSRCEMLSLLDGEY